MKKLLSFLLILPFVLYTSCDVLEQVAEAERFIQCDFALTGVKVVEVSGIDFTKVHDAGDLGVAEMMTLGQRVLNGNLPATLQVDIRARNNSSKQAGISGMGWKVFIEDNEFIGGHLNRSVQVPAYHAINFPVDVKVDLLNMLEQESLPKILNLVFGMEDNTKLRDLGLYVKIKPSYKTSSGSVKEFPTWITIRP